MLRVHSIAKNIAEPMVHPVRRMLEKRFEEKVRSTLNLVPITEFSAEDVLVVGYPKSGNTWFQNLVAGVIYGVDPEYAPDTLIQELQPDVHYKRYYKRFRTSMFFKSHYLPKPEYKRVVYLLRDGRDVMVSYYHHNRALMGDDFDFFAMVRDGVGLFPCKWHEHVEAWLANPYGADMILIKYEDLQTNPVEALQRFCEFVDESRDMEFLRRVAIKASFNKMREKEVRYGWDDPQWPREKPFVRRGRVGSYKDEMPQDVLNVFLSQAGETLRKLGYL